MESTDGSGKSNFRATHKSNTKKRLLFIAACIIGCFLVTIYAATVGSFPITNGEVFNALVDAILRRTPEDLTIYHIVVHLRMPAIITALVCGFSLAVCGVCMQSMLKNPLADPYTMGISSGAGFGAAVAIILGLELINGGGIVMNAFVFSVVPALVILMLSKFRNATPTMMILCGIALMYMFNAMTQLFMLIADPEDLSSVYKWMIGSVDGTDYGEVTIVLIIAILGTVYIQYMANQLNILGLGDEGAKSLGVNVERQRLILLLVVTLMAATVVSFTGIIGFIGLVAPHMVRSVIGSDNRFLVPASGFFGALLLLVSHLVAMTIASPTILPVGVITSCIGGPLFLYLILRNNKEVWA